MPDQELDVRPLRKPDKHPAIFQAYDALAVSAGPQGLRYLTVHQRRQSLLDITNGRHRMPLSI